MCPGFQVVHSNYGIYVYVCNTHAMQGRTEGVSRGFREPHWILHTT